ncbi:MAG: hypothetical protein ACOCVV_05915 [Marinobacter sp.]
MEKQMTLDLARASLQFDQALAEFARARRASPEASSLGLLERARLLMILPGGFDVIYRRVRALESAGIFGTSDWSRPAILQPALARHSLREAGAVTTVVEAISELRLLAVVRGDYFHPGISSEQARHFLTQVLALNLDLDLAPFARINPCGHVGLGVTRLIDLAPDASTGDVGKRLALILGRHLGLHAVFDAGA